MTGGKRLCHYTNVPKLYFELKEIRAKPYMQRLVRSRQINQSIFRLQSGPSLLILPNPEPLTPRLAFEFLQCGEFFKRIRTQPRQDRKSTRLNSSHVEISYAVF